MKTLVCKTYQDVSTVSSVLINLSKCMRCLSTNAYSSCSIMKHILRRVFCNNFAALYLRPNKNDAIINWAFVQSHASKSPKESVLTTDNLMDRCNVCISETENIVFSNTEKIYLQFVPHINTMKWRKFFIQFWLVQCLLMQF